MAQEVFTIIRNLTNKKLFLSWVPLGKGSYGVFLNSGEQIRYQGNIIESIWGVPEKRDALSKDVSSGKILITVCGDNISSYPVFDMNIAPEFKQWGCVQWLYNSSSSAWMEI